MRVFQRLGLAVSATIITSTTITIASAQLLPVIGPATCATGLLCCQSVSTNPDLASGSLIPLVAENCFQISELVAPLCELLACCLIGTPTTTAILPLPTITASTCHVVDLTKLI
ncbi:hypothetical protein C8Q75DRAFT_805718 [Abortiporus biennis]|nr:hypothetical protein C8Q75DRAFT_805718 [Abortiporus biennis]